MNRKFGPRRGGIRGRLEITSPNKESFQRKIVLAWPVPKNSKKRVKKAGKTIADVGSRGMIRWGMNVSSEDFQVVENWRASHGAVLNTAQAWLRRLEKVDLPVVGQRLKRLDTIVDKLATGRAIDLSTMHDIAGVRAIFRKEDDLLAFREKMDASRARHSRMHEPEKFDYISRPKPTGYRGIHDVYKREVAALSGVPWNGLKFEVQLRTFVQHAWATAVEIYDSTQLSRFKFTSSSDPAYEQFVIISEIFSRVHEDQNGCLTDMSDNQLLDRYLELESKSGLLEMFRGLKIAAEYNGLEKNTILQRQSDGLFVHSFPNFREAIEAISDIEGRPETINAVLVGSSMPQDIRSAFQNYFDDTKDFVTLLDDALDRLSSSSQEETFW